MGYVSLSSPAFHEALLSVITADTDLRRVVMQAIANYDPQTATPDQKSQLRDQLLDTVALDVNGTSSADRGRRGMDYWSILVLGAVRLGCNLNYARLQNLAAEPRPLRLIMGVGGWREDCA